MSYIYLWTLDILVVKRLTFLQVWAVGYSKIMTTHLKIFSGQAMQKAKFVITQHSFNLYTRAKVTNCTVKRLKPNRVGIIVHYEKFKYMYVSGIIQAHHNVRPRDATMMKYRQIARFR